MIDVARDEAPAARPREVVDRDAEWGRLAELVRSDEPELCIVLGRRRAGKSFVLTRLVAACNGIYYQATRRTEREQLATLSRIVGEHFDDPAFRRIAFESWEHLFEYLIGKVGSERLVIVLDEFTYLADAAPALPSILQNLWDHALADTRLKLVLAGSHVTAMRRLTRADQPLYGRRTSRIEFMPFSYADAARFVPGYDPLDKLRLYGILGGLPGHLARVDPHRSLVENASRLILDPTSRLYDEGAHMFDAFLGDAEVHYSIMTAIANGETRWGRISNRVGRGGAALQNPLRWLMEMGVVSQEAPITEYPNPARNKMRYSVPDPYLVFWHRFIADIKARGLATLRSPRELWAAYIEPRLDDHMGPVFEDAARSFVRYSRHPRLPFRPIQVGSWWTDDGQHEVDVVAIGGSGEVLFGEAKWGTVSSADLDALQRRAQLVLSGLKVVRQLHYALFSGRGLHGGRIQARVKAGEAIHYPLAELFIEN